MATSRNVFRRSSLALEPRMLFDAAAVATAVDTANQASQNAAPTVTADATHATHDASQNSSDGVAVFKNTVASTGDSNQHFSELVLTVDKSSANEALIIDGTRIALVEGSGTTSGNLTYRVTVTGDKTSIAIDMETATANSASDLQTLIDGIRYSAQDGAADSGTRTVTLTSVKDNGGTDNGGSDTTALNVASTIELHSDDQSSQLASSLAVSAAANSNAPQLGGDSTQLEYAGKTDGWNSDVYTDVLEGTKDTVTSSDGNFVYTVNIPSSGGSSVNVYSRAADGSLTRVQSLFDASRDGGISGMSGAVKVVLSADQQSVYVIGDTDNAITVFSRDSASGKLTLIGSLKGSDINGGVEHIAGVVSQDNHVYVTADNALFVFTQANGVLTLQHTYTDGMTGASSIALLGDGSTLFVASSGGTSIATAFHIEADGSLTKLSVVGSGDYHIQALTISPDGKTLYAINNGSPGTLEAMSIAADGTLTLLSPGVALDQTGTDLVIAADGSALFMVGESGIKVFQRDTSTGKLTFYANVANDGGQYPINFTQLTSISLSADGKQLYISGRIGFSSTLMTMSVALPSLDYTEGGEALPLLPSAHLSSPVLDASGNYQGATLTITRDGGAQSEDTFSFKDGNGLNLQGTQVFKNGVAIATLAQVNGVLTVTFINATSQADAQNVLRQLTYSNTSQDPEHAGSAPTFTLLFNDGNGNSASIDVAVKLTGVNDPSTLVSTVLNPTLQENGEYVKLFNNTTIDTIESGQLIWHVIITVDATGPNERLLVGGVVITLEANSTIVTAANGMQYRVTVSGGIATLTIYQQGTPADTAALIDGISYNNTGSGLSGSRHITLSIGENSYNGSAPVTQLAGQVVVTLAPPSETNTAPVLGAPTTTPAYTERAAAVVLAADATLSDVQMDKLNGGSGNYDGAVLTIKLGSGASGLDKLGFLDANGLTLKGNLLQKNGVTIATVSNVDGVMTIRFSQADGSIPTSADVQNTLRQITYVSTTHAPAATVAVEVTLADRVLTSQALSLSVAITAVNDAPLVVTDPVAALGNVHLVADLSTVSGLDKVSSVALSSDGLFAYVADGKGAIAVFNRDAGTGALTYLATLPAGHDLNSIEHLQLSSDGKSLFVVGNSGGMLAVFERNSDGTLVYLQSMVSGDSNEYALGGIKDIVQSADGNSVYVIGSTYLLSFSRDASSHELSFVSSTGSAWSEPYLWQPSAISIAGDVLFVTSNFSSKSLMAFRIGSDGSLTLLGYIRNGSSDAAGVSVTLGTMQHLTSSADGQYLYLASGQTVSLLRFNADTGQFTMVGQVASQSASISSMQLSADGNAMYITTTGGLLSRYAVVDHQLVLADSTQTGSSTTQGQAQQIALGANGAILVARDNLTVLQAQVAVAAVHKIDGTAVVFAQTLNLSDAELDAANNGAGNYQGASISITRSPAAVASDVFGLSSGNGLTSNGQQIFKDGNEIATMVNDNGVLTVRFTASISSAEAMAVLHQLTYASGDGVTGTNTLVVTLNDGSISSASATLSISILAANQAPVVNGDAPELLARAGQNSNLQLPADLFADPDGDALVWRMSGLPAGMVFDPSTRSIRGTPVTSERFSLTLTVTDPDGASVSRTLVLTVQEALPVPPDTPAATPGSATVAPQLPVSTAMPDMFAGRAPAFAEVMRTTPAESLSEPASRVTPVAAPVLSGAPISFAAQAMFAPAGADSYARSNTLATSSARDTLDFLEMLRVRRASEASSNEAIQLTPLSDGSSTPQVVPAVDAGTTLERARLLNLEMRSFASHPQTIPMTLEHVSPSSAAQEAPAEVGKQALSQQLRQSAAFDLLAQVRQLLSAMAGTDATPAAVATVAAETVPMNPSIPQES
jgi:6-phosphogluconolactonase (cycloisomerase 2 family)